MSRRQFVALADVVASFVDRIPPRVLWDLANDIADICARENGRFDRQRFRTACGLDPWNPPAS